MPADADPAAVVTAWPSLPVVLRAGILAMVKSVKYTNHGVFKDE
jgi:hypothetical protein